MSFSNRLTTFFILMVLIPIIGIGVLGFRLINENGSGRGEARAGGLVTAASQVYTSDESSARADAEAVAQSIGGLSVPQIRARIARAADAAGLVRVRVRRNGVVIADVGSARAVAPGTVDISDGAVTLEITASNTTAAGFTRSVSGPLSAAVLSEDHTVLASTLGHGLSVPAPTRVSVGGVTYVTATYPELLGFGNVPVSLTMLSDLSASTHSDADSNLIAALFLAGLALLAFSFAVLASRGLNEMVKRFLSAATRLANRDFSARVPVDGHDEFARLGTAFNEMSDQLQEYIDRLDAERQRLRESIRRTGDTFASSLDKEQLEAITLSTALTGLEGGFGRMTRRENERSRLEVVHTEGPWQDAGSLIIAAERAALTGHGFGEAEEADLHVMAVRLGMLPGRRLAHGTLSIGRRGEPFGEDDRDLFRSLAAQAWRALDNVRLHDEADRKATTDLLTGLANHGEFQTVLGRELRDVRRYHHPVGLILLDLDNFKDVNDTHGHLQGDAVLRDVADVLRRTTREGDTAARYGGEEMALILPHTDLDGAFAIAERVRHEIAALTVPLVDGSGELHVTASIGVSATRDGEKDELVNEADVALYEAKRSGKNRVVRAASAQRI